ncbi:hypothetical protein GF325_01930 [Candidatus Bathyarchaeota archaeon]|nr:hypothetical protein [Candidatus Bathyarchaeota archaeon]
MHSKGDSSYIFSSVTSEEGEVDLFKYYLSDEYKGMGVSEGLQRGLLVTVDGKDIVQEGMGMGAPALVTGDATYFSANARSTKVNKNHLRKEFTIDSVLTWRWNWFNFKLEKFEKINLVTWFINKWMAFYKERTMLQAPLLKLGMRVRKVLSVDSTIKHFGNLGKVIVDYHVDHGTNMVNVQVNFGDLLDHANQSTKICIMNEFGGDYFDALMDRGRIIAPPTGWVKKEVSRTNEEMPFYSTGLGVSFDMGITSLPDMPVELAMGRENLENFCWAGYDLEIDASGYHSLKSDPVIEFKCTFRAISPSDLSPVVGASKFPSFTEVTSRGERRSRRVAK